MQADIFCRVIDNYGDIGVAWRLARQLKHEHNWQIRLWIDDLKTFQRLEPAIARVAQQDLNGIEIIDWTQAIDFTPRPVVIATFSCDLPERYIENLRITPSSLWINLEYLSAEAWVEDCHQLPSLRSDGLSSYFFFPGFTEHTGGLLRESDLIPQRNAWQVDRKTQRAFLINLGLSQAAITALFPVDPNTDTARLINLFCYENAPVASLIKVLSAEPRQTVLLIPEGIHTEYQSGQQGKLFIERVPFLPQIEYDKVLWTADLNFVRGEDSIVRGIWAGKPLIWQIYPQTEHTHLEKLQAWFVRAGLSQDICKLILSWNPESVGSGSDCAVTCSDQVKSNSNHTETNRKIILSGYTKNISAHSVIQYPSKTKEFFYALHEQLQPANFALWQQHSRRFCAQQVALPDLATALAAFCQSKLIAQLTKN